MIRLEELVKDRVPEARRSSPAPAARRWMGGQRAHRGQMQIQPGRRSRAGALERSDAFDLRRHLSGLPGVIVRANAAGGNGLMNRLFGGTTTPRLAL